MQVLSHCANTHTGVPLPVKAAFEPDTPVRQRRETGGTQEGLSSNKPDEVGRCRVLCVGDPVVKAPAADVLGCAAQRRLVGTNFPGEAVLPSSLPTGSAHKAFPCCKSKMLSWNRCLKRDDQVIPNNKHFKFPYCFLSKHFMDICGLSFTSSSAWKMSVATL